MTTPRILVLCGCLALGALAAPGGQRLWQFTSGEKLTAEYLWSDRETLYLRDPHGKKLTRPVGLLARADLEFVRAIHQRRQTEGIVYEVPLTWENYHSKNVKSLDAEKAGAYPLDSKPNAMAKLELEFKPVAPPPALCPGHAAVLRLTTSSRRSAGTKSTLRVVHQGEVVGTATNIAPGTAFDVKLSPRVLAPGNAVNLTLACGSDTVHLRTEKSGAGARLLIIDTKLKPESE